VPGESLDLDEVYERVLVDVGGRKLSFNIGKAGILWKLDRQTGQFIDAKETVFQNVFVWKDKSKGVLAYRPDILEQKTGYWIPACPSTAGGKDWQAMSYDPGGHARDSADPGLHGNERPRLHRLTDRRTMADRRFFEMPAQRQHGQARGLDVRTMAKWTVDQRLEWLTGVLTTDGGPTFVGDLDRTFHAYDTATGKELWKTRPARPCRASRSRSASAASYIAVLVQAVLAARCRAPRTSCAIPRTATPVRLRAPDK
jgi:alcohol dehydrogenase (cytochrome c)